MKKLLLYWIPLIIYLVLIFYFSSLPRIELVEVIPQIILKDKLLHVIEYSILSILFYRTFNQYKNIKAITVQLAITFTIIYGLTDEFHQLFVPGRFFSIIDLLADSIGSCSVLIVNFFYKHLKKV